MRLRVLPLVAAALFAVLVLSAPAAHASGVVTVDDTATSYASWYCSSGSAIALADFTVCVASRQTAYTPGGTAGQSGTISVSNLGTIHIAVSVCTSVPASSAPHACSTIVANSGQQTPSSGVVSYGYTVPSVAYYVTVVTWSAGDTVAAARVLITANSVTPPEIPAGDWPVVNLSAVSDNTGGLFAFLAPILWLVGGISIGGLLLHKARGMF